MILRVVRLVSLAAVLFISAAVVPLAAQPPAAPASALPMARQIAVREGWLARRYDLLLRMMRAHKVGMWIVVNEEFHDDPLTALIAPPRPYVGRRDIFVFTDAGEAGLVRVGDHRLLRGEHPAVLRLAGRAGAAGKALPALVAKYTPATIALVDRRRPRRHAQPHATTPTRPSSRRIGPEAAKRIVPAEPLIEEFLDTRMPEEMPHYALLVEWTEHLARRALSNEVITPGVTTVGDVRRWLYTQSPRPASSRGSSPTFACSGARPRRDVARVPGGRPGGDGASSPATSSTSTSA